jgi:pimeloyl-ACP methyl ester carboxylesterase
MIKEFSAGAEAAATVLSLPKIINSAPRGDGHSVIVLPGFYAGSASTCLMRYVLHRCGYAAVDWGQGVNFGPSSDTGEILGELVRRHSRDQTVSLVGWSLGGLYARALANLYPDRIRRVYTLGTPVGAAHSKPELAALFNTVSPTKLHQLDQTLLAHSNAALSVPVVNFYSKSDGVVDWTSCVTADPGAVNIQVPGSHMAMTHNAVILSHLLDWLSRS